MLKKSHSFYQHTHYYKKYTPAIQPKIYFWLVSEKNIYTAPFLDAQELHSQSTWKANISIFRSSGPEVFVKKMLLEKCCLKSTTLSNKRLWNLCFPVNFAQFLRKLFLTEHLRWLCL